ncbi:MAG: type IV pilus secretin PilQ [Thioalkalivibrionaceae bacterium]
MQVVAQVRSRTGWVQCSLALGILLTPGLLAAQTLEAIQASGLGGDRVQVNMRFSAPPPDANVFAIENPARLAIDLPGVKNAAGRTTAFDLAPLTGAMAVEAGDRTRVILNLDRNVQHATRTDGNEFIVVLGAGAERTTAARPAAVPVAVTEPVATPTRQQASAESTPRPFNNRPPEIVEIDFQRGSDGEGRVIVNFDRAASGVDVIEDVGRITVRVPRALIDDEQLARLNVNDFATPVSSIVPSRNGDRVELVINASGEYDVISFQSDRRFVLEVAPISTTEREARARAEQEFIGERLSLNFQDIEVRSVLQLLADFTDLNIVVSDSVQGNITLRLNNVPWDQALDIILRTRGLDKREQGNVIYVAPQAEIADRERSEFEAIQALDELEPLRTEFIQVNFVKAETLVGIIRESGQRLVGTGTTSDDRGLLSSRGSITVDPQSNIIVVQDSSSRIADVRALVDRLDTPVRQVLIETRIVVAQDNFSRDLGVRFGVSGGRRSGNTSVGTSGSLGQASGISQGLASGNVGVPALPDRLNVALPALADNAGRIGFSILRPNVLLDLELSALQAEGRGEIISTPRVLTTNGRAAEIRRGTRFPIRIVQDGTAEVDFVEAFLETKVTPQITATGSVILDIQVSRNDADFAQAVDGIPAIVTRELDTQVRMENGETVVLGGIYEIDSQTNVSKVPFLGDLPIIRHLFRTTQNRNERAELLIFVTPRVIE